ncbi:hypothetical protein ESV24_07070 [Aequorivita lipolytica]|uniref:DUF2281 domain-containing protein n=2 Tax=Aequorivita lipolytica TaxID=153267 RepID=A0A5C6YRS3_9FLAO|nr:hypothetical protein ESV24_07070 [Aequorivita lipolytica]
MTKEALIQKTIKRLSHLPTEKITEVLDFADCIAKKYEDDILQKGIATLTANSKTYGFLDDEEDLYTLNDLKAVYK